jgi:hypothetical protein
MVKSRYFLTGLTAFLKLKWAMVVTMAVLNPFFFAFITASEASGNSWYGLLSRSLTIQFNVS